MLIVLPVSSDVSPHAGRRGAPVRMPALPADAFDVRVTPGDRENDPPKCVSYRQPLPAEEAVQVATALVYESTRVLAPHLAAADKAAFDKLAADAGGVPIAGAPIAGGSAPDPLTPESADLTFRACIDPKLGEPHDEPPLVRLGHAGADDEREIRPADAGDWIVACCGGLVVIVVLVLAFFLLSLLRGP